MLCLCHYFYCMRCRFCSDVRRLWLMRTCNHCVHCRFGLCCVFGCRGKPAALQRAALQPAPIQPPDAEGVGCTGRRPLNSLPCLGTVNRFWHTRQAVAVPGWQSAIGLPGRILVSFIVVARCCSLVSCRMVLPPCPWPGLRSESMASSVYGLRASMSLDFFVRECTAAKKKTSAA